MKISLQLCATQRQKALLMIRVLLPQVVDLHHDIVQDPELAELVVVDSARRLSRILDSRRQFILLSANGRSPHKSLPNVQVIHIQQSVNVDLCTAILQVVINQQVLPL